VHSEDPLPANLPGEHIIGSPVFAGQNVPPSHTLQLLLPAAENVPLEHGKHSVLSPLLKKPGGHPIHCSLPVEEIVPVSQTLQALDLAAA
jgi:hypothetical protein